MKGLLTFHEQPFPRTHDLEVLQSLAAGVEPAVAAWNADAERLTEYGVAFRYPGEVLEPSRADFEQAFGETQALYDLVLRTLPPTVHPGQ